MNLISRFALVAREKPDQIALITDSSQMTFLDVVRLVNLLDHVLQDHGVKPGHTIVLAIDRAEFTVAMSLVLSLQSLNVIFSSVEAVMESGLDFDWAIVAHPILTLPGDRQIVLQPKWFEKLATSLAPDYSETLHEAKGAFISRTSGSTGTSKFVWNTEAQRMIRMEKWLGVDNDPPAANRRLAITMSPANVWALTAALSVLFRGGSAIMLSADQPRILSYIDLYRVDTLLATPALLSQLARDPVSKQYLGSLRDIRVGGAQAPRDVTRRVASICDARIHLSYGAAEVGAVFSFVYDRSAPQPEGYLGQPVEPELEIGLYSESNELQAESEAEGLMGIRVNDTSILRQYLKPSGVLEAVVELGDVFFPGDIVRRDETGYYYIGRSKRILNAGGEKYSLDQIGAHLTNMFGSRLVVPVVTSDPAGMEGLAIITENDPLDMAALESALAVRFPNAKVLQAEAVDRFPLTPSGKVDTIELATRLCLPVT